MAPTGIGIGQALSEWFRHQGGTAATETALDVLGVAEERLASAASDDTEPTLWHEYLDVTGAPDFLECLPDRATRDRWAESAFRAVRHSGYSLRTMLDRRVAAHPDRVLFSDRRERTTPAWTYAQVAWYARTLAGVFLEAEPDGPRVAIFADNGIDEACTDLACLAHGLLVTPLNVHFDAETVAWIFERLNINVVVTDSDERVARLAEAGARSGHRFRVFRSGDRVATTPVRGLEVTPLRAASARMNPAATAAQLAARPVDLLAPATVMFTSGSTGQPKGVVFSQYTLVTKRFARAAALPAVGRDEVLLCYLPLFHTFGRYLEMLGTIYWRGTYVFAGSPAADHLIAALADVRPTGLISVPVRWMQIRQQCLDAMDRAPDPAAEVAAFRAIVGDRLRWGLSAAGFLDPLVFRFFQRHGVDLCSGFGMTEGTGGITMTPPGSYVDGTVGLPLPGMRTRFGARNELQIAGPYVARYLDEEGPPGSLPRLDPDEDHWIATGDLFTEHEGGYLEIVDRIKDIYKNNRGQTVAPQRVEHRFASVPGFRRTFLAGDHRDYNVLLIVLNRDDPVLSTRTDEDIHEYLGQIVASVNASLAPYERVVRFAVIDRDFEVARGELTEKGSLRRKVIADHFQAAIETLYRDPHVELLVDGLRVRIPHWFFRDLAVLEGDIVASGSGLHDKRSGVFLPVAREADGRVRVGDLLYRVPDASVDLGLFARQARLWIGNPSLVAFSPCKPGWDVPLQGVSDRVRPHAGRVEVAVKARAAERLQGDERHREIHGLSVSALFGTEEDAAPAIERLSDVLAEADPRFALVIRRRLEALAFRPEEDVRARAYRVLLLDEPAADDDQAFPTFVESGLTFLNELNIAAIAWSRPGERRLQALRQRLYSYRVHLAWPGPPARRTQFTRLFRLLADLARNDRESVPAVQAELACWALFREHPALARAAGQQLDLLTTWYEGTFSRSVAAETDSPPDGKVVFESGIPAAQCVRLRAVLSDRTFLRRSITDVFGEEGFTWQRVPTDGAWVSPVLGHHPLLQVYRLGINLVDGKHFDLLLVVGGGLRKKAVRETVLWLTALSGHAFGPPALPRVGAWRADLGAIAIAYVSDLTAWDRIRELSRQQDLHDGTATRWAWRKLFVRAMVPFFRAWEHSGCRIVPGAVAPANVAVPDADFHEGTSILSATGWHPYDGPVRFTALFLRNFYRRTEALYPQSRGILQVSWIFDACVEALGPNGSAAFFGALAPALAGVPTADAEELGHALVAYLAALEARPYVPLPVLCAIQRFQEWERLNPAASHEAREEAVIQMIHLYRLERFHEAFRVHVYQHTYFAGAGAEVAEMFDRLVARKLGKPRAPQGQLEELSELQGLMVDARDRDVFSRMVFPQARRTQQLEIFEVGPVADRRVLVRSVIRDARGIPYEVREPITPVEIGHLYRLVLETDYPKRITAEDRHLVIVDQEERIVGGLCYRWQESKVVYVDGVVVSAALLNQGLGGRLLEDLCVRMAAEGARCVTTNLFLGQLFSKHGFQVNQRWGGLVRFLVSPEAETDAADRSPTSSPCP